MAYGKRHEGVRLADREGERGFVGFPEAPVVVGGHVYAGSGDTYVYAIDLVTGHRVWRTKMPASNEGYTACGKVFLVNCHGIAVLNLQTGHLDKVVLTGAPEFVTSDFAVFENQAFIAGPKGVFAFACD